MARASPKTDAHYLEMAAAIIFMGGLNRSVVGAKWPGFRQAFHDFDVDDVAKMTPADVDRLAADGRVIRHRAKLDAVVRNAGEMRALAAEFGSFSSYIDGLVSAQGVDQACAALAARFAYISKAGARNWLFATGHDVGEVTDKMRSKYAPFAD
jgi:DNA-3-methyladenine glycosylase I